MFRVTSGNLYSGDGSTSDGTSTSTVYSTPATGVPPLRIIKRFEFSHKHAYMSVIVRDPVTGRLTLFLKGALLTISERLTKKLMLLQALVKKLRSL
jgi:magnesium-transporting ATPase (P-type)